MSHLLTRAAHKPNCRNSRATSNPGACPRLNLWRGSSAPWPRDLAYRPLRARRRLRIICSFVLPPMLLSHRLLFGFNCPNISSWYGRGVGAAAGVRSGSQRACRSSEMKRARFSGRELMPFTGAVGVGAVFGLFIDLP